MSQSEKYVLILGDKTLMQSLVQDAIVTEGIDKHTHSTHKEDKQYVKFD